MDSSKEIFKNKSLQDLYKEIYDNSNSTKKQIKESVKDLKEKVSSEDTTTQEAIILSPMLVDYLEVSIKNDDQLLKLASLIVKSEGSQNGEGFDLMEFQHLLEDQEAINTKLRDTPK